MRRGMMLGSLALALAMVEAPAAAQDATSVAISVTLSPTIRGPQSGRLIVFAKRVEPGAKADEAIDTSPFEPSGTAIAARETTRWTAGQTAQVDGEADAFPAPFSTLPPGTYRFQAVLDRNHNYNYRGRDAGDLVSPIVEAALPGRAPVLTLATEIPAKTTEQALAQIPDVAMRDRLRANLAKVQPVEFVSPAMTRFRGQPTAIRGWVALPPGYGADGQTYPTVYSTGGFGSTLMSAQGQAAGMSGKMASGAAPPMIWVILDESSPTGTHEFADSANNGPWGQALTEEFIPWIEGRYAMDARAGSRFLTGHSSGGWASLWLQVRYPKMFGGTWPTSPDPSDFHDFTNVDIYAAKANAYRDTAGQPTPVAREKGKVIATQQQFAAIEQVLGPVGGQFASFDWVFSPKGADGKPVSLFDRATGDIDAAVATYWRDHYDIAHIVARDWPTLESDLDGKIHLIVGTADTFYLDGPARRLQAVFERLGAHQSFTYIPDRTHFDLFHKGKDNTGLLDDIAWQMYRTARPATTLKPR